MKSHLILLALAAAMSNSFAALSPATGKRLADINVIPTDVLQRSISPWFYKSLLISPIEGWVIVEGQIVGTKFMGGRILRSDLDGAYDQVALQRAKKLNIAGNYTIESHGRASNVLLHFLVYKVADGTMALSFANFDIPGGNQMDYFGCAQLEVLKNDGHWIEIKGPASLHGKGIEVRARGMRNSFEAVCKLEKVKGLDGGGALPR
jgi:hypothetical protein